MTPDPEDLAADGDDVVEGVEPPTEEELEAHQAAEAAKEAEHGDG